MIGPATGGSDPRGSRRAVGMQNCKLVRALDADQHPRAPQQSDFGWYVQERLSSSRGLILAFQVSCGALGG